MFGSIEEVQKRLLDQSYIAGKKIATVVYLASKLNKPVLVEGPAGVGKTELAKVVAAAVGRQLIRLQCYEGLDESKALYEWEYSKQLLYTQMLRDKISDVIAGTKTLKEASERIAGQDDVFFSERFIVARPLLKAITSPEPVLLLIDEVDKSDPEFEAFLLEVLSDYTVSVPEVGTIQAKHLPLVFLTSNDAREMTDALKRRCLHLHIDFPSTEEEVRILELKVPGIGQRLVHDIVELVQRIRKLDLKKTPSISETLDWARALMVLNADELETELVNDTMNVILKHQGDIAKAQSELNALLQRKAAEKAAAGPVAAPPQAGGAPGQEERAPLGHAEEARRVHEPAAQGGRARVGRGVTRRVRRARRAAARRPGALQGRAARHHGEALGRDRHLRPAVRSLLVGLPRPAAAGAPGGDGRHARGLRPRAAARAAAPHAREHGRRATCPSSRRRCSAWTRTRSRS